MNMKMSLNMSAFTKLVSMVVVIVAIFPQYGGACSRVLWNDNSKAVVVGRSLDWFVPNPADLYVLPRGINRDGMTGENTLTWKAKYGTVMTYSQAVTDGINEKGLAGHLLFLLETDFGQFDPASTSLSVSLWLQYYLDNFATVEEAVSFTRDTPFKIVPATLDGVKVGVHLALEDATGDSAVIEYLDGKPVIYHGKEYTVMTNSPTYDEQLKNRAQYEGFGGNRPLPGTTKSPDRFVRASYYLRDLFEPEATRECVAGVLSIMRNVSQPFSGATSAPNPDQPNESTTRWLTIGDLTNRVYYYASTMTPNIIWVKLDDLDFSEGTTIRKLDLVNQPDRIGDITKQFETAKPFPVLPPDLD